MKNQKEELARVNWNILTKAQTRVKAYALGFKQGWDSGEPIIRKQVLEEVRSAYITKSDVGKISGDFSRWLEQKLAEVEKNAKK